VITKLNDDKYMPKMSKIQCYQDVSRLFFQDRMSSAYKAICSFFPMHMQKSYIKHYRLDPKCNATT